MSKHNNIYNILGKLSALEPKPEPAKSILNELATPSKSDFARHLNERYLAEKDKGMSRAAKGYEKYGKQGMEALAKAGKAGKDLDPIRKKYDKYDNTEVEEGWKGALAGGIAGAGLGSVVPGLGTVAGGIAGAYAGHKIGDQGISDPDSAPSRTASPQRNAPIKMTAANRLAMPSGPRKASFQKTVAEGSCNMTMEGSYCPEHGLAKCEGMYEGHDDPMNSNSAMTGSYYEGKETDIQEGDALLARIKSLALLR